NRPYTCTFRQLCHAVGCAYRKGSSKRDGGGGGGAQCGSAACTSRLQWQDVPLDRNDRVQLLRGSPIPLAKYHRDCIRWPAESPPTQKLSPRWGGSWCSQVPGIQSRGGADTPCLDRPTHPGSARHRGRTWCRLG